MGFRNVVRRLLLGDAAGQAEATFAVEVPPEMVAGDRAGRAFVREVTRDQALSVPAVMRGRNLICSTIATLPIRHHGPDRRQLPRSLFEQIDPDMPNSVVLAQTLEDLVFEAIAWWRVVEWDARGWPVSARYVPAESVHIEATGWPGAEGWISRDNPWPEDGRVVIDGRPMGDHEVIRFDSPNPPLLRHAARAIRQAINLDQTAELYSTEPLGLGYFRPDEGADGLRTDDEITAMLDRWQESRRLRAWGYMDGMKAELLQWDLEKLQLHEQRQHAVLEIARAMGIDPEDLGVSTTSRTYANNEQRRMDLTDFTLGAYVSAVQDRLSMGDVLPRGHYARISFAGFLRSDTQGRMTTYATGLPIGAYTVEEIRELEDRPALTPAELAAIRPAAPAPQAEPAEPPELTDKGTNVVKLKTGATFAADSPVTLTFEGSEVAASFKVDAASRTLRGLVVPWGKVAMSGGYRWRFAPGSIVWSDPSRVKLLVDHDMRTAIGRALELTNTAAGLEAVMKVARGAEGDRVLSLAEDGVYDGFSAGVGFDTDDGWVPDPSDPSVRLVKLSGLREISNTAFPSFDDARVRDVAASRNQQGDTMSSTKTDPADAKAKGTDAAFNLEDYLTSLSEATTESHKQLVKELGESIGESITAGFAAALENVGDPQGEAAGPQPVRAARFKITREAPIYSLNGAGHSLVRDAWYSAREHDSDAQERLRRFRMQTEEVAKLALERVRWGFGGGGGGAQFAPIGTGGASQVIPPGYRPDLFVPQLAQGRPFVNSLSRGTIENATPFVVPVFGSSGGVGNHTEGVNPADGTLTFTTKTVTPGAKSGKIVLTREIVDSSNPAIDQIALAAMREDYARQTEAQVYAQFNGADGAGGVITNGFVPSGAQVITTTGGSIAAGTFGGAELLDGFRLQLALYPFRRFAAPDRSLLSQEATSAFATAKDTTGRPLLPSIGAENSNGLGNAIQMGWSVDGLPAVPAWAITGNAAADADVFNFNAADAWAWESALLTFRFEEKQGPANIELALFGYFASHILRPVGLAAIRHTRAA